MNTLQNNYAEGFRCVCLLIVYDCRLLYFGVSDRYFLNLQNDIDVRNLKEQLANEIAVIRPYQEAAAE